MLYLVTLWLETVIYVDITDHKTKNTMTATLKSKKKTTKNFDSESNLTFHLFLALSGVDKASYVRLISTLMP